MESCAGPVPSGGEIDTGSVGLKTFAVHAWDKAGNAVSESRPYGVVCDFTGFFGPVLPGGIGLPALAPYDVSISLSGITGTTGVLR